MNFKFLTNNKPIQPPDNFYLMFNMDDALINVIRWLQYHNIEMLSGVGTELSMVNVPVANCYMRILNWGRYERLLTDGGDMIEINYRVMELNNGGRDFTFKMEEQEFLRRIDITGI
jgi:hypothetical protein